jgi:cytochrome c biogenesis protein CcdA
MAEYWWIGYILMIIGWFLAGFFRRQSKKRMERIVKLEKEKIEDREHWFKIGHDSGVLYHTKVVQQKIENILKKSGV